MWTVKELIEQLQKQDPDARVKIRVDEDERCHGGWDLCVEGYDAPREGKVVRISAEKDGRGFDQI